MRTNEGLPALTEKEKQTLRLIVRGHDAKSTARSLGLSVHTINERLRDARRKLAVSSSREAARLLLAAEGGDVAAPFPQTPADNEMGEDGAPPTIDRDTAPPNGVGAARRRLWIIIGGILMTLFLGLVALLGSPQAVPAPEAAASGAVSNPAAVDAARRFVELIDQEKWDESYRVTATSFRKVNTVAVWADASRKARGPLGTMLSRTLLSQEMLPVPPAGFEMVKFRSRFANKPDVIETVTLGREDGAWRVVGVIID